MMEKLLRCLPTIFCVALAILYNWNKLTPLGIAGQQKSCLEADRTVFTFELDWSRRFV